MSKFAKFKNGHLKLIP